MTQTSEQRRHRRLAVQLPVTLINARGRTNLVTEDISFSGIFVRTDNPTPLRQLVKFRFTTPDTNATLEMLAMVVYTVSLEQSERLDKTAGMGLNLYGLDRATRDVWIDFVQRSIEAHEQARLQDLLKVTPPLEGQVQPIRRRFPRYGACFSVRVETIRGLYEVLTRNIGAGGAFLTSEDPLPQGTEVNLIIIHPEDDSEYNIKGYVVRSALKPHEPQGFGVRFEELDKAIRGRFIEFIESGLPVVDIEEDLIIESDDSLLE